jgi:hypothetical protein
MMAVFEPAGVNVNRLSAGRSITLATRRARKSAAPLAKQTELKYRRVRQAVRTVRAGACVLVVASLQKTGGFAERGEGSADFKGRVCCAIGKAAGVSAYVHCAEHGRPRVRA